MTGDGTQAAALRYRTAELTLDRQIHRIGIVAALIGAVFLVGTAAVTGGSLLVLPVLVYAAALLTMLSCSAAYNVAPASPRREILRRFDHAAIFVMIAGTYTPFTVDRLSGAWSVAMTSAIWAIAVIGAALKLFYPRSFERTSLALYLVFGWIGVIALKPLWNSVDLPTLALLGAGGALYSIGTLFHSWHRLPFQNAVWHGFVLFAASCHFAAVAHGVVLAPR